jgi:hypothetical protein
MGAEFDDGSEPTGLGDHPVDIDIAGGGIEIGYERI